MSLKIAIASGKGGTGKTTVAVNLYLAIEKYRDKNVTLMDCDVEEPNDVLFFQDALVKEEKQVTQIIPEIDPDKCTYCRKCVEYCEFNAILIIPPVKYIKVSPDLCHSCGACFVACQHDAMKEIPFHIGDIRHIDIHKGNGLIEGRLKVGLPLQTPVIRELKKEKANTNGITILDASPGTSCSVVNTISDCDYVILVAEPTPFGLHDLKLMVDLIYVLKKPFGVVINKANLGDKDIYKYLKTENIELLTEIPFDKKIAESYAEGKLLSDVIEGYEDYYITIINKLK